MRLINQLNKAVTLIELNSCIIDSIHFNTENTTLHRQVLYSRECIFQQDVTQALSMETLINCQTPKQHGGQRMMRDAF